MRANRKSNKQKNDKTQSQSDHSVASESNSCEVDVTDCIINSGGGQRLRKNEKCWFQTLACTYMLVSWDNACVKMRSAGFKLLLVLTCWCHFLMNDLNLT